MKTNRLLMSVLFMMFLMTTQVFAVSFEPTFSSYPFPGTQFTVDAAANAYYGTNFGINIDNAYLYKDSRDTFDGIGISVGEVPEIGTPQTGQIFFLDTTDYVEIDYWGIRATTYSAFNGTGDLLDTFSIGSNTLGSYFFNPTDIISLITWSSDGGYGQISNLRYNYDGTTDGRNDDINGMTPIPEPSTFLLLGGGLAGLAFVARRKRKE